jgi:hypothetical protein
VSSITGPGNAVQVVASPTEGWFKLLNARKWHYFRGTRSLCGKWMYLGSGPLVGSDNKVGHPDDCVACQRKRMAE